MISFSVFLTSCSGNKEETKSEVPAAQEQAPVEPSSEESSTSVKAGPGGAEVKSSKTDVQVNADSASVEIKK